MQSQNMIAIVSWPQNDVLAQFFSWDVLPWPLSKTVSSTHHQYIHLTDTMHSVLVVELVVYLAVCVRVRVRVRVHVRVSGHKQMLCFYLQSLFILYTYVRRWWRFEAMFLDHHITHARIQAILTQHTMITVKIHSVSQISVFPMQKHQSIACFCVQTWGEPALLVTQSENICRGRWPSAI